MSTLRGRARVHPDGTLRLPIPDLAGAEVEYALDVHPAAPHPLPTNGTHPVSPPTSRAPLTQAEWESLIRRTAGSMPDFPGVERPGPDSYEQRERWD